MKEALYLLEHGVRAPGGGLGSRASESTPVYGADAQTLSPELQRERQVETWRELGGQWESDESADEEIAAIFAARTGGREVEL